MKLSLIAIDQYYNSKLITIRINTSTSLNTVSMTEKCPSCNLFYKQHQMKPLNCQKHHICNVCFHQAQILHCQQCEAAAQQIVMSQRSIHNYPIQGMMVNFHKRYNPEGESQFTANRNCQQRTTGWIMCNLLAIVFFFSGLAMAIKTTQRGTGIILAILGVVGIVVSIFFICKIKKVDKYFQSIDYIHRDNFIYIKKNRQTISSVKTQRR